MHRPNTAEVKGIPSNIPITNNLSVDALPKQFIASMKTLFDILDDKRTGFVRFSDIEKGWQDDGCKGLPRGVLDSLRKVTPANGFLSFERFCAGLKLCLLRNQAESVNNSNVITSNPSTIIQSKTKSARRSKSPRSPAVSLQCNENMQQPHPQHTTNTPMRTSTTTTTQWCNSNNINNNPTATVRPRNHVLTTQRTLSLPQLSPDSSSELEVELSTVNLNTTYNSPPPKPPRAAAVAAAKNATLDKNGIRNALQNWQMGLLLNEMDASEKRESLTIPNYINNRGSADGGSSSATDTSALSAAIFLTPTTTKKGNSNSSLSKRREPRRHTLQNGIDFNMLRRLKQYEEEREVLLLGLDAIEKTREWYLQQIESIQEKIRCIGCMGEHVDHWSEVQQERLNFQRTRVLEVNRNLEALADSWERGGIIPSHFNLAISNTNKRMKKLNNENLYMPPNDHRHRHKNCFSTTEIPSQQNLHFEVRPTVPRRTPLRVSQSQASPATCSSSSVGGLIDADIVY